MKRTRRHWLAGGMSAVVAIAVIAANPHMGAAISTLDVLHLDAAFLPSGGFFTRPLEQIRATSAWALVNSGDRDLAAVAIGIVDTGLDASHPEFDGVSLGSTPEEARRDSGQVRERADGTRFLDAHGTKIAGLIGANNLATVSGRAYELYHTNGVVSGVHNLAYTLEARDATSQFPASAGRFFNSAKALLQMFRLGRSGVEIVNLSVAPKTGMECLAATVLLSPFFGRVFRAMPQTLFVMAAGNGERDVARCSPAAFGRLENVITVAAVDLFDRRALDPDAGGSNFGTRVSIAAPGSEASHIYVPSFYNSEGGVLGQRDYDLEFGGTSAAAAFVTGVAAILKSLEPEYQTYMPGLTMSPREIKEVLQKSADPIITDRPLGSGCFDPEKNPHGYQGCRLNAHRAVAWYLPPEAPTSTRAIPQSSTSIALSWQKSQGADLRNPDFASYRIYRGTSPNVSVRDTLVATLSDPAASSFTDRDLSPDTTYFYKVFVVDRAGLSTESDEVVATTQHVGPGPVPPRVRI